jgi:hypothetical protein
MQRILAFVLRLYLAVMLTLWGYDSAVAYQRTAQFRKMEDCCNTAADQYQRFDEVAQRAAQLDHLAQRAQLGRLEHYLLFSAWEEALVSAKNLDTGLAWERPGHAATERLSSFLARQHLSEQDLANLAAQYRAAGPDADPILTEAQERAGVYLQHNLAYLSVVMELARTELHRVLEKEAGGPEELESFVGQRTTAWRRFPLRAEVCSPIPGAEAAANLGKASRPGTEARFRDCTYSPGQ